MTDYQTTLNKNQIKQIWIGSQLWFSTGIYFPDTHDFVLLNLYNELKTRSIITKLRPERNFQAFNLRGITCCDYKKILITDIRKIKNTDTIAQLIVR